MSAPTRPWAMLTPIQALVEQACDPTLPEPNHAVNIELAELVSSKKANSAREATHALLGNINSRNPNQSLLALHTLDYLVRNCGYPVHLQISTKEFLNELVRRFPERPPMVTGRVMAKILELIHEWKNTLCVHSKYKEDLVHIRDMHRLLSYKGYRFKSFDAARALSLQNPNENLKSPDELEEEDRAAKSAKLQELIRRATPKDLAQAQELMKQLSGAEPDKQVDYASQTLAELDKVQSKAILLNDMLNNAREGEKIGLEGDVYDQVAHACRGARPRIQKWIEEDTGEREGMMDRLLLCNDLINNALERFEACKAGDWGRAQAIVDSTNPNQKAADLISFDAFADDEPMSGDGGLHLPTGTGTGNGNGNGAGNGNASGSSSTLSTSSGLPLDLFSAPSPSPSHTPVGAQSYHNQNQNQSHKQDPMAFFNTPTPFKPAQTQASGYNVPMSYSPAPTPTPGPAQAAQGFAAPIAPVQPQQQAYRPAQSQQHVPAQQQQQQQPKKDAFADLVDLMD